MTGLSTDKPLFLFLYHEKLRIFKQYEYVLQWKGDTKIAPWTILHVDKETGKIAPFISGLGYNEYLSTINKSEKQGISQSEIFWGGPPCKKEAERLGLVNK